MPLPAEQVKSSLAVKLTRSEKHPLDLLPAWPRFDTEQLMGRMGGVTRRRSNQVLQALTDLALIRTEGQQHVLTDEGLTWLDRRTQRQQPADLHRHHPALHGVPTRPSRRPDHPGRLSHHRRRQISGLRRPVSLITNFDRINRVIFTVIDQDFQGL